MATSLASTSLADAEQAVDAAVADQHGRSAERDEADEHHEPRAAEHHRERGQPQRRRRDRRHRVGILEPVAAVLAIEAWRIEFAMIGTLKCSATKNSTAAINQLPKPASGNTRAPTPPDASRIISGGSSDIGRTRRRNSQSIGGRSRATKSQPSRLETTMRGNCMTSMIRSPFGWKSGRRHDPPARVGHRSFYITL